MELLWVIELLWGMFCHNISRGMWRSVYAPRSRLIDAPPPRSNALAPVAPNHTHCACALYNCIICIRGRCVCACVRVCVCGRNIVMPGWGVYRIYMRCPHFACRHLPRARARFGAQMLSPVSRPCACIPTLPARWVVDSERELGARCLFATMSPLLWRVAPSPLSPPSPSSVWCIVAQFSGARGRLGELLEFRMVGRLLGGVGYLFFVMIHIRLHQYESVHCIQLRWWSDWEKTNYLYDLVGM